MRYLMSCNPLLKSYNSSVDRVAPDKDRNLTIFPHNYTKVIYEKVVNMGRVVDITGQRFGRLIVLKRVENNKHGKAQWLCKCDCGNTTVVVGTELRNGHTKSCGCLHLEQMYSRFNTKHGKHNHKLHGIWLMMKDRCNNTNNKSYKNYGGRGIKVCEEWKSDFMNFYNWAMQNGYDENAKYGQCTLDRIDNNGNYEPSNCRWVDNSTQQKNTRRTRFITYNGKCCDCGKEVDFDKHFEEYLGWRCDECFDRWMDKLNKELDEEYSEEAE